MAKTKSSSSSKKSEREAATTTPVQAAEIAAFATAPTAATFESNFAINTSDPRPRTTSTTRSSSTDSSASSTTLLPTNNSRAGSTNGLSSPTVPVSSSASFEALYLRQATAEFADELDRLRGAADFSDRSVPMLVEALRQGAARFSEAERRRAMGG